MSLGSAASGMGHCAVETCNVVRQISILELTQDKWVPCAPDKDKKVQKPGSVMLRGSISSYLTTCVGRISVEKYIEVSVLLSREHHFQALAFSKTTFFTHYESISGECYSKKCLRNFQ